jgi:hypothetical protein
LILQCAFYLLDTCNNGDTAMNYFNYQAAKAGLPVSAPKAQRETRSEHAANLQIVRTVRK